MVKQTRKLEKKGKQEDAHAYPPRPYSQEEKAG